MKLNHHPSPYNLVAHNNCWGVATSRHLTRDLPSQSPKDNAISPPLIDYLLSSPSIRTTINFLFIASRNALSLIVVLARAQDTPAGVWPSRVQNHQHKNHLFFLIPSRGGCGKQDENENPEASSPTSGWVWIVRGKGYLTRKSWPFPENKSEKFHAKLQFWIT